MDLSHLSTIAKAAALSAGKIILKHLDDEVTVQLKNSNTSYAVQVVTEIDLKCETEILSHLLPTCKQFDIAMLSEETEDDGSRFEKDFFWCIDPIDGTLAFINKQPGFSVSIALVAKDGTPHIGVVFNPSTNTLYHAIKGIGVFKNDKPWIISNVNKHLTYVTDTKLSDMPHAIEINKVLKENVKKLKLNGIKEMSGAGSVLNAIYVLENGPACMLKLPKKENGGGSIWDFAATACMFNEFGLPATDFNGNRLDLNKSNGSFMNVKGIFYSNFE